jgi:molybdopterin adenylyltransferase
MSLPEKFEALVITLSDRAHKGEYEDLSGPLVQKRIAEYFVSEGWDYNVSLTLIPDDPSMLSELLVNSSSFYDIIITTGGTGIGPRDITVDVVKPMLSKEIPGIMEMIRIRYGAEKPNALLSRSVAGIMGKSLIYTLPGSVRAVNEYMDEIVKTLTHTIMMQHGIDKHSRQ